MFFYWFSDADKKVAVDQAFRDTLLAQLVSTKYLMYTLLILKMRVVTAKIRRVLSTDENRKIFPTNWSEPKYLNFYSECVCG